MSGRPSLASAVSALWHALGAWSRLYANRKTLRDATRYRVEVRLVGTVAGYPIDEQLNAWLTVGSPSLQASSATIQKEREGPVSLDPDGDADDTVEAERRWAA